MGRKKPMSKDSRIPKKDKVVRAKGVKGTADLNKAAKDRKRLRSIPIAFEVDGVMEDVKVDPDETEAMSANWNANAASRIRETKMDQQAEEYRKRRITESESTPPTVAAGVSDSPLPPTTDEDTYRATKAQVSTPFLSGKSGRDRDIVNSLSSSSGKCIDPIKLKDLLWPDIIFYREQEEIIYSVLENDETYVVAANQMGKDFVAAYIALYFFLSRSPCRVLTTSVDHYQLEGVLWGEIRRFLQTSKYSLDSRDGGPLVINHMHLRKIIDGKMCGISYMLGRVSAKGEGMLGHHVADVGDGIPRTLCCFDEGSGIEDINYEMATTWAKRVLVIGNAWPTENFFRRAVDAGDIPAGATKL